MGVKEKIAWALSESLADAYVRLQGNDGISGFVVSPQFDEMPVLDRQELIDDILARAESRLTSAERDRVLLVAALAPIEFDSIGAPIRVRRVKETASGAVEVVLHGRVADADYVRRALRNCNGIETTEPRQVSGPLDTQISFRAKGTKTDPLTREKAIRLLKGDRYIEVLPHA